MTAGTLRKEVIMKQVTVLTGFTRSVDIHCSGVIFYNAILVKSKVVNRT